MPRSTPPRAGNGNHYDETDPRETVRVLDSLRIARVDLARS
jgi:hypothetical protein